MNILPPFVRFVWLLLDTVATHVGNPTFAVSVLHVNVAVWTEEVIVVDVPAPFLIVPVPPFAFNVIVFVFAEQLGVAVLLPLIVYPVLQLVV